MSDWDHGALAALLRGLQGKAGFILSAEAKVAVRVLAVLPVDREFFSADRSAARSETVGYAAQHTGARLPLAWPKWTSRRTS